MIGALYISWHCSKAAWMELSFLNILYVAVGIHTDTGCLHGQAWSGWDMDSDRATVPDQGGPQEREKLRVDCYSATQCCYNAKIGSLFESRGGLWSTQPTP
jgi:hypothetical protein